MTPTPTPREQALRDRTVAVVRYDADAGEDPEWVVTMGPPDDGPVEERRELTFTVAELARRDATIFKNKHLAQFLTKAPLEADEWTRLADYWLAIQEPWAPEPPAGGRDA